MVDGFVLEFGLAQKIFGRNSAANTIGTNHNQRIMRDKLGFAGADVVEWHVQAAEVKLGKFPLVAHIDEQRTGLLAEGFQLVKVDVGIRGRLQRKRSANRV